MRLALLVAVVLVAAAGCRDDGGDDSSSAVSASAPAAVSSDAPSDAGAASSNPTAAASASAPSTPSPWPTSTRTTPPVEGGIEVYVDARGLSFGPEQKLLIPPAPEPEKGFPQKYKLSGRHYLASLRSAVHDLGYRAPGEFGHDPNGPEPPPANVFFDPSTPFKIYYEVAFTLSFLGFRDQRIVTAPGRPVRVVPGERDDFPDPKDPRKWRRMKITLGPERGVTVVAQDGNVTPGCEGRGAGQAVPPPAGAGLPTTALHECVKKLRAADPKKRAIAAQLFIPADQTVATGIALRDALEEPVDGEPLVQLTHLLLVGL